MGCQFTDTDYSTSTRIWLIHSQVQTSTILDMPSVIDCNVEFGHLNDYSIVYQCKPGCDQETVIGNPGEYSAFSRICSSAIHSGVHDRNGGLISIKPSTTSNTYKATLSNKIWSKEGGAAPSFIIRKVASEEDLKWSCIEDIAPLTPINVTASSYLEYFTESSGLESVSTYLNWNPSQAVSSSLSPWAPDVTDSKSPWLEIDLGPNQHTITKLVTYSSQIRYFDFRTDNFTMAVWIDNEWEMVLEQNKIRTFVSTGQPSYHHFPTPVQTTKFRIYPVSAEQSPVPAMKLTIFGCQNQVEVVEGKTKISCTLY